jgi:hypothetical protein
MGVLDAQAATAGEKRAQHRERYEEFGRGSVGQVLSRGIAGTVPGR